MADTPDDSTPAVKFWSSYRFCIDPDCCVLKLFPEQPPERTSISVPADQWRALKNSVTQAQLDLMLKASGEDEGLRLKRKIGEADERVRKVDIPYDEVLRHAVTFGSNLSPNEREVDIAVVNSKIDSAKETQARACKEYAEWVAKHRGDDPWLRDPDVRRGIKFACETEDEGFFRRLGRALSDKPKPSKLVPVMRMFAMNWIVGDLPLAIFTDEALAGLCSCMSEQWGEEDWYDKDRITQRREDYGLENLGSIHRRKAELGLTQTVGSLIKSVRWTGAERRFRVGRQTVRFHELIASDQIVSVARTKLRISRTKKPQRNS